MTTASLLPRMASALLVGALLLPSMAAARDYEEEGRVKDAEALLETLATQAEVDTAAGRTAFIASLNRIPTQHNALRTKSAARKLRVAVGDVIKGKNVNVTVRLAAVEVAAKLHDDDGAWKILKPALPKAGDEAAGQVQLAALTAAGRVAADGALSTLQDLARRAKDPQAQERAVRALGGFGYSRHRAKVLEFLIQLMTRMRPGNLRPGSRGADAARQRYNRIAGPLIDALNRLTGRNEAGAEVWLALYKENRKRPESLFRFER